MKELVTVLSLIGAGVWVVHDGAPWIYRMAIQSGNSPDCCPDPKFVGFNPDGPNTRHEMQKYRDIYRNPQWVKQERTQLDRSRRSPSWQSSAFGVIPTRHH